MYTFLANFLGTFCVFVFRSWPHCFDYWFLTSPPFAWFHGACVVCLSLCLSPSPSFFSISFSFPPPSLICIFCCPLFLSSTLAFASVCFFGRLWFWCFVSACILCPKFPLQFCQSCFPSCLEKSLSMFLVHVVPFSFLTSVSSRVYHFALCSILSCCSCLSHMFSPFFLPPLLVQIFKHSS